jgi:hypothetical protein
VAALIIIAAVAFVIFLALAACGIAAVTAARYTREQDDDTQRK